MLRKKEEGEEEEEEEEEGEGEGEEEEKEEEAGWEGSFQFYIYKLPIHRPSGRYVNLKILEEANFSKNKKTKCVF